MTNIALALALEPNLSKSVRRVIAMGGVLSVMGNVSPVASANILGDAHAADIVLGTDWDVTLVPADTTRQVKVTDAWLDEVGRSGHLGIYFQAAFFTEIFIDQLVSLMAFITTINGDGISCRTCALSN